MSAAAWALQDAGAPGGPLSLLDARGPGAAAIAEFWWILLAVTGVAATITIAVLLWAVARSRRHAAPAGGPPFRDATFIVVAGAAIPAAILIVLLVLSVRTLARVLEPPQTPELIVEVVGHRFWWEVRYPQHDVVTANEIHIPAGRPVEFRVTSDDVIHSFWVPRLHGKIDMNPDRINRTWLQADEPGVYRGVCTEFCGSQHALMAFLLIAQPPAEFETWLERRRRPAPAPAEPLTRRGLAVYFEADCHLCHAIRGVVEPVYAVGVGPDLTHLASRRTLAAATLPNNRGNLAGWILRPQDLKPRNLMPNTRLPPADLHALLAYLETLQ